ncbi:MAG: hypothetical protein ACLQBY_14495 [Solirubrobacteraceae bacterium]
MSWKGFKKGWNELMNPPKHDMTPEERAQRERRSELPESPQSINSKRSKAPRTPILAANPHAACRHGH